MLWNGINNDSPICQAETEGSSWIGERFSIANKEFSFTWFISFTVFLWVKWFAGKPSILWQFCLIRGKKCHVLWAELAYSISQRSLQLSVRLVHISSSFFQGSVWTISSNPFCCLRRGPGQQHQLTTNKKKLKCSVRVMFPPPYLMTSNPKAFGPSGKDLFFPIFHRGKINLDNFADYNHLNIVGYT